MAFVALLTSRLSQAVRSQSSLLSTSWSKTSLLSPTLQICDTQKFSSQNNKKDASGSSADSPASPESSAQAAAPGAEQPKRVEVVDTFGVFGPLRDAWWRLKASVWVAAIQVNFEAEFTEEEFLEGCRDAYFMVNSLVSEESWDDLKNMVSPRFLSAFRGTQEEYRRNNQHVAIKVPESIDAKIASISLQRHEDVRGYFSQQSGTPAEANSDQLEHDLQNHEQDRLWLVVLVELKCALEFQITNAQGQLASVIVDHRGHKWKFGRLIPWNWRLGRPRRCLDHPWYLLSIE
ncbi:hypothetical protein WJX73_000123 [Symbiochloris irregularis]|uniref:Tim44-like domain-containing protein n=1 Tax=Symbiochloris irregularis TaxID=706552 RepID=A0AAW1Q3C2_9CHLO